ncbi:MAG: DUF1598 domain-containing protein [Candidatus Scalindua sp.]
MMKKLLLLLGIIVLITFVAIHSCSARATKGRAISLKVLENKLENCMAKGNCPEEILQLCGIKRVLGYIIDKKHNDIILFGKVDDSSPPLHLEDFVIALRNEWLKYATLKGNTYYYSLPGCTIDPNPKVINKLQQIGDRIFSNSEPAEVTRSLEQWHNVCRQPQKVGVFGIPFDSRFSKVMVEADYYMKRLVDGSVTLDIDGFTSLTEIELDIIKEDLSKNRPISIPMQTLNRFEFVAGDCSYVEDEDVIRIKKCQVKLVTEEEFLSRKGKIQGRGRPNPLAKEFADDFTEKYDAIAKIKPIYYELGGLYRFVALAKLMKFKEAPSDAGISLDFLLERFPINYEHVKPTRPGISNVKEFQHKREYPGGYEIFYLWLPSCGGVSIDIIINNSDIVKDNTGSLLELKRNALKARPDPEALYWDFP